MGERSRAIEVRGRPHPADGRPHGGPAPAALVYPFNSPQTYSPALCVRKGGGENPVTELVVATPGELQGAAVDADAGASLSPSHVPRFSSLNMNCWEARRKRTPIAKSYACGMNRSSFGKYCFHCVTGW